MSFNPSDTTFAIIKEVTAGTTPSTPAFLNLDFVSGTAPMLQSNTVVSAVSKPSRAAASSRRTNYSVGGGIATELNRDAAVEALLEGALSGAWATNVLKAGKVDTNYTIEERKVDGATSLFQRFTGCQVSNMALTCDLSGIAGLTFDVIGMNRTTANVIVTGATYAAASVKPKLVGLDVSNVTIAGVAGLVFTSLNLTVGHNRETQGQFGSATARGVGTSGIRTTTLELTCYRESFAIETTLLAADTPVAVSFTIGAATGGVGYTFTLPAAYVAIPKDSIDGSKSLVTLTFTASEDTVTGTDLQITRLA